MILLDLTPAERLHVAAALRDRARRLRRNGGTLPDRLTQLAEGLERSAAATSGHPLPPRTAPADDHDTPSRERLLLVGRKAAHLLGVSERTLRRRAARGEIPSVWEGRRRRYRLEDLAKYAAELPAGRQNDGDTRRAGPSA